MTKEEKIRITSDKVSKFKWWLVKRFGTPHLAKDEHVICVGYFYKDVFYIEKFSSIEEEIKDPEDPIEREYVQALRVLQALRHAAVPVFDPIAAAKQSLSFEKAQDDFRKAQAALHNNFKKEAKET